MDLNLKQRCGRNASSIACLYASAVFFSACALHAGTYYPDDPLWKEPPPVSVGKVQRQRLDNLVDFYKNTFYKKGERHQPGKIIPSKGANTLGELPDSAWYTNRHRNGRMTLADLVTGPNRSGPPSPSGKWKIISAKAEGVTPGFTIEDAQGRRYLLKFDPPSHRELATGADAVSARFFYALGYNVPENYAIRFRREQLTAGKDVEFTDRRQRKRPLRDQDIDDMLDSVAAYDDGSFRGLASFYIAGEPVGPFKYYGRRADDPNELAPHEHLRQLRGLHVFAAWLNHTDAKSLNSLDVVVEEEGRRFIKHYLIDFGATLGSDSLYAKDPRLGHQYFLAKKPGLSQLLSLGFYIPDYARVNYPDQPAVGNFSVDAFDPSEWRSNYPNAAFLNRLPGDEFWGAKQVAVFTDNEIRAIVKAGEYSDPSAEKKIADTLIARRDRIVRTLLMKLAPLDRFRVSGNELVFDDLAMMYGLRPQTRVEVTWGRFDNSAGQTTPIQGARGPAIPTGASDYAVATVRDLEINKSVMAYLRRAPGGWEVVGLQREGENDWRPR
jgi:hypothetical protein